MTSPYTVHVDTRVVRELRRVPQVDARRILDVIDALAANPKPRGAVKLRGQPGWRIRVGVYRILYEVDHAKRRVTVYRAGHRADVYR
jgi:mRNA interferase RelE/StbE